MIQIINILTITFLIGLAVTVPLTGNNKDGKLVMSSDPTLYDYAVYTSEHDIVNLIVPLSAVNFDDNSYHFNSTDSNNGIELFFVEADVNDKGQKEYKGLYYLKNFTATKVLETGTDASAITTEVYISAKDGIYVFNAKANKTEKYGNITDSLIGIFKMRGSDVLYVLTEDHDVYKVTDGGYKKEKLQDVKDAQQILLDYSNNLYFYGKDKVPYVVTENGVKKILGTLENPSNVKLIRPPFSLKNAAGFAADDKYYIIFVNGTSKAIDVALPVKPIAYAPEVSLIQFYSYNKKIYNRNMILIALMKSIDGLEKSLQERFDVIKYTPTRSREEIIA